MIQAIEGLRRSSNSFIVHFHLFIWVAGPLVNCANITSQVAPTQKLAASYLNTVFRIGLKPRQVTNMEACRWSPDVRCKAVIHLQIIRDKEAHVALAADAGRIFSEPFI